MRVSESVSQPVRYTCDRGSGGTGPNMRRRGTAVCSRLRGQAAAQDAQCCVGCSR